MFLIILYLTIIFILFSFSLTLWYFKKEMDAKMKYVDFIIDAEINLYSETSNKNHLGRIIFRDISLV